MSAIVDSSCRRDIGLVTAVTSPEPPAVGSESRGSGIEIATAEVVARPPVRRA